MMWVLVALSSIELAVVHLLLFALVPRLALLVSGLSLCGVIYIVALILSFRRLPVLISDGMVLLRVGRLRSIAIPVSRISQVRRHWDDGALKASGTLNLALIAYPNLLIDLDSPVPGRRREVRAIAHKLDAPDAFLEALSAAKGATR